MRFRHILDASYSLGFAVAVAATGAAGQQLPGAALCERLGERWRTDLSGPVEQLVRVAELEGGLPGRARTARRPSDDVATRLCGGSTGMSHFRVELVAPVAQATSNSGYPDDRDNGIMWAGRGTSTALGAGAALELGPLTVAANPVFTFQENRAFAMRPRADPTHSPYSNGYTGDIDLPQRFGPQGLWRLDAGQSFARIDLFRLAAGVSTENLWVGPAARYPILMSNTAGGFTHAFVGTSQPLNLWIFEIDGELVLGGLTESRYFDVHERNDDNRLSLWTLAARPRLLPGLELGFTRSFMFDPDDAGLSLFAQFLPSRQANLAGNELAAVYGRWLITPSGTELYGEWARDDRFWTIRDDFITEIDHSQAYMVGFQQLARVLREDVRIHAELAHLQEQQERRPGRSLPVYYTHSTLRQGYTHRGQLLGASIGPGADAQFLGVDVLRDQGTLGVFVERVRRNTASPPAVEAREAPPYRHDVELIAGMRVVAFWRDYLIGGSMSWGTRWNRDFITNDDNLKLSLEVRWMGIE